MARLNIEDMFWLEIMTVAGQMGGLDCAIGNAIRFFRYAQERHRGGFAITENEFSQLGFHEALIPLFAKRTERGIEAAGADKFFSWLEQKSEAGKTGGRISAQRERDGKGRLLPKRTPSTIQAESKLSQPSLSSSLSKKEIRKEEKAPVAPIDGNLVAEYYRAWNEKYKSRAPLMPKDHAQLRQLGENLGFDTAKDLIKFYFKVPNDWFSKKRHDVQTLMANLNVVQEYANKRSEQRSGFSAPSLTVVERGPCYEPVDELTQEQRAEKKLELDSLLKRAGIFKTGIDKNEEPA